MRNEYDPVPDRIVQKNLPTSKTRLERWLTVLAELHPYFEPGATLEEICRACGKRLYEFEDAGRRRYPVTIARRLDDLGLLTQGNSRHGFYLLLGRQGLLYHQDIGREFMVKAPTAKAVAAGYARKFSEADNEWTEDGLDKLVAQFRDRERLGLESTSE
jgi:hypothetical protein